jgi:hypothetical protein
VRLRGEITVSLPVVICRDEIRAKLAEAIAEISGDYRSTIALGNRNRGGEIVRVACLRQGKSTRRGWLTEFAG